MQEDHDDNGLEELADQYQQHLEQTPMLERNIQEPWVTPSAAGNKPEKDAEFSPQSLYAIKSLMEALEEPSVDQIDGFGHQLISVVVQGQFREMHASFASAEEHASFMRKLVESCKAMVTWNQIQDHRMGVLDVPVTTSEFLRSLLRSNGLDVADRDPHTTTTNAGRLTVFLDRPGNGTTFSLRKHGASTVKGEQMIASGTIDPRMWEFLVATVRAKANVLIIGEQGSGKTTLLRSLAHYFGDNEKIAVVEAIPELHIPKKFVAEYVFQPTVEGLGLHDILDTNLYNGLQPGRLIVGESHLEGLTKTLEVMIYTEGSMTTYHAFSAQMAAERMKLALQMENPNLTAETAASFIRQAVELLVVIELVNGVRRVTQIAELDWRGSAGADQLAVKDLFKYLPPNKDNTEGRFVAVNRPDENGRITLKTKRRNVPVDPSWFLEPEHIQSGRYR